MSIPNHGKGPPCDHPQPWIEYYDCGCKKCLYCNKPIGRCHMPRGPECKAAEMWVEIDREKGALTDEDVRYDV